MMLCYMLPYIYNTEFQYNFIYLVHYIVHFQHDAAVVTEDENSSQGLRGRKTLGSCITSRGICLTPSLSLPTSQLSFPFLLCSDDFLISKKQLNFTHKKKREIAIEIVHTTMEASSKRRNNIKSGVGN